MVSADARNPMPPLASACRRIVALSFTLTALLCAISAPRAFAQNPTPGWEDGDIEVDVSRLEINEGHSLSYRVRLTKQPTADGWFVRVHVDGAVRYDGFYDTDGDGEDDIQWLPSVGWEFNQNNWDQWRTITVIALQDDDDEDTRVIFTHDVWDHTTNCPVHDRGRVEVRVVDDELAPGELPTLSIGDAEVREGGTARFDVTLSADSRQDVTVSYQTSNVTAEAGSDYEVPEDTLLTFPAGTREQHIFVHTNQDDAYEGDETFTVRLSGPAGATLRDSTGTGTITDDDDPPAVVIDDNFTDVTVPEGDPARFEVTLSAQSILPVRVRVATMDGTAVAGSDYTAIDRTLTFQPGTDSLTVDVSTRDDSAYEETETFTLTLSDPENAALGNMRTATGTITDDDEKPEVSIGNAPAVTEGGTALFPVTLSPESGKMVTVTYRTMDGTAEEGSDYMTTTGTLEFSPGTDRLTIAVPTSDDDTSEPEENFTVELSDPTEATLREETGEGTIRDDDGQPALSIADAEAVTEADGPATFTVTLSGMSSQIVSVAYATRNGTATAGSDYTTASGTLEFQPGDMEKTVSVTVLDDNLPEDLEQFTVALSSPSNATIAGSSGAVTIIDDDAGGVPSLRVLDASAVTEGDPAQFTVTMSVAASTDVTVAYRTMGGTAEEGSDYTGTSGTLTFTAGQTTRTIPVTTINDSIREPDESFSVILSNPSGATMLADDTATGTITDNDSSGLPGLSIFDATVSEGETALFRVRLSVAGTQTVTVNYETVDDTAIEGTDYTPALGSLEFRAGAIEQTIVVRTVEDGTAEQTETFTVQLRDATGATLEDDSATGTITDDDDDTALPALSIADAEPVTEGATAQFEVTLSAESQQVVTVAYATADGTAVEDSDYTQTSGTLTFAAGETTKTIPVPTIDDDEQESEEHFTVTLSRPEGATLDDSSGQGTITDDDGDGPALPQLSIADASAAEGDTVQFTVTLTGTSNQTVTVDFQTGDGTAKAGSDFTAASGTVTFTAGETAKSISVATLEDTIREEDETFSVTLTNPEGATLADDTATGTITDDDDTALPALSIADAEPVTEGATAQFEVTLNAESQQVVTVAYATADGTAVEDFDYIQTSGTLTFAAGETTKTIPVPTIDDDEQESEEHFTVTLSRPEGATLDDSSGQGTITDDDGDGPALPQLSIADASAAEGDTVQFTVTLTGTSNQTVTVDFQTGDGTAKAGSDFTAASGTVTFTAGETAKSISVATLEDTIREEDETFSVTLTNPEGATLADDTATGTITDDDDTALPALSIADAEPVTEGATAQFEVTLNAESQQVVTVAYATADGTAVEDSDYTQTSGTLTFAAGETTKTIPVPTIDDDEQESEEHFTVTLSRPEGATLDDSSGQGTVTDDDHDDDDDMTPRLYIVDASADEGDAVRFRVVLTGDSDRAVTVDFETDDGTALAGSDYEETSGTLTFAVGTETQTISVPTHEDDIAEADETFTVRLSDADGATIEDDSARGTINDNDGGGGRLPILTIEDAAPVGEGETAQFSVTLSSQSEQVVTASYGTADGTASAGSDYTSTTGTLRFEPGDTTGTIRVTVLDDEIWEDTESFTVELSDPEGAALVGASGTASITDDDEDMLPALSIADAAPVPEGGTASFVVTLSPASERAVRVSYRTLDGTATAGLDYTATAGTLRFQPGETTRSITVITVGDELVEGPERFAVELSNSIAATIADGTGTGTISEAAERIAMVNRTVLPELGRTLAFSTVPCRFDRTLSGLMARDGSGPAGYLSLPYALTSDRQTSPMHQSLTLERALGDSAFLMPMQDEDGEAGRFAAWGCGDYRHLGGGGGDGGVAWNGEAFSMNFGADVRLGSNTLAGLSISRSRGSFDYHAGGPNGRAGGAYDLRLTGLHPYVGWSASPDLDVWGTVGHAWGELRIADDLVARTLTSAATLDSGAMGVNGRLLARGTTSLNLKGEAALARLDIAGDGAMVEALAVNMRRLRLSTEASRELLFASGGSLTPWGELGVRHDGGDGETGVGLEVSAGLRYQSPVTGWTSEGYGRWLAAHEGALREWGFGGVIRYDPGASGRGPSVSLMPGWGDTASGVRRLWEHGATDPTVSRPPGSRLDAQFGYGFAAFRGRGVLTPFGAVSLDPEYGNGYRIGSRIAGGRSANLSLEVERRERAAAATVYAVFVRGALQF